jgi:hypothetical protein
MDTKPLVKSKSAQGAVIAAIPAIVKIAEHYGLVPEGQMEPVTAALVTLTGVAWSIIGTLVRGTKIGSLF